MEKDSVKKNSLPNLTIWLLSIVACILLITIVFQNIQMKNSKHTILVENSDSVSKVHKEPIGPVVVTEHQQVNENILVGAARQEPEIPGFDQAPDPSMAPDTEGPPGTPGGAPPEGEPIGGGRGGGGEGDGVMPPDIMAGGEPGIGGDLGSDRAIVSEGYGSLLEKMGLSSEESEAFARVLAERRQYLMQIEEDMLTLDTDDSMAFLDELEASAFEYDEKVQELLGYENYQKLKEYNSCTGIFLSNPVDEFNSALSADEKIDDFQTEQLVSAMAEEYDDFLSSTLPEVTGPSGFKVVTQDEETVSKIVDNLDDLQEQYFTRASSILTGSQLKTFKAKIGSMINERKLFFQSTSMGNFNR